MLKIFESKIFLVVVTAIICITGTAFATLTYSASQITYTKGNNTMYLSDAIDELYGITADFSTLPDISMHYAYGSPTTSSPQTPPVGKRIFNGLYGTQRSVCLFMYNKIHCFAVSNYAVELEHLKMVFSEENCWNGSSSGNSYYQCGNTETDNLTCRYYSNGNSLYCYDLLVDKDCTVTSSGSSTCS